MARPRHSSPALLLIALAILAPWSWAGPSITAVHDQGGLRDRIERAWNTTHGAVRVAASSPGAWAEGPGGCTNLQLIVLLSGHYRTMDHTQRDLHAAATAAAGNCYAVAAFLPAALEKRPKKSPDTGPEPGGVDAVVERLERSPYRAKVAYAVAARTGTLDGYGDGVALGWHASWAVALWAAGLHGVRWAPSAVVLRTRPDILLPVPLSVARLASYFARGPRGRHLALAGEFRSRQGDLFFLTSASAYATDVVGPFEAALRHKRRADGKGPRAQGEWLFWWALAVTNGWGYGRSIANRRPWPGLRELLAGACYCPQGDGKGSCAAPACLLTVLEAPMPLWRAFYILRGGKGVGSGPGYPPGTPPLDVARGLFLYCRARPLGPAGRGQHIVKKYFRFDSKFGTSCGTGHHRLDQPVELNAPRVGSAPLVPAPPVAGDGGVWPEGCDGPPAWNASVVRRSPPVEVDWRTDLVRCEPPRVLSSAMACQAPYDTHLPGPRLAPTCREKPEGGGAATCDLAQKLPESDKDGNPFCIPVSR